MVDFGTFWICGAAINHCPIRFLEVAIADVRADSTADRFVYEDVSGYSSIASNRAKMVLVCRVAVLLYVEAIMDVVFMVVEVSEIGW